MKSHCFLNHHFSQEIYTYKDKRLSTDCQKDSSGKPGLGANLASLLLALRCQYAVIADKVRNDSVMVA